MTAQSSVLQKLDGRLIELEARSRRLEKQNMRLRVFGLLTLALCAVGILAGGGYLGNDLLEARGLILRSPDGRLRGSFVVSDDGGVRLTLVDHKKRARAGLWLDENGQCSLWGFDNLSVTGDGFEGVRVGGSGKLITVASDARIIERQHDKWVCAYKITLRNDTNQDIDQAFYVNLVDAEGYVLGRQARMIRMRENDSHILNGEIKLHPERGEHVQRVMLTLYEP